MKRLYFLLTMAALQILLGSILMLQAAQPIRMSEEVLPPAGSYYVFHFAILGSGRVIGNLSEVDGRSLDVLLFDQPGFAAFRDGTNGVPPLFSGNGTRVVFDVSLPGFTDYYVVAVDLPARGDLHMRVDVTVFGLKPIEAIVALIVLAGGLALVGASLTLSVWSWRHALPSQGASADPAADSSSDPAPRDEEPRHEVADDKTRIY